MNAAGAVVAALLLPAPALAASEFPGLLKKAQARGASDPERVEFASRAVKAWLPADSRLMLAQAHRLRAEGLLARLDEERAAADLDRVVELDPGDASARLMRSRARVALGLGAGAEDDASAYLVSAPGDAEGWLALGEARLSRGTPAAGAPAREAFAKAAGLLGAADPRPRVGEGRSWLAERRPKDALDPLTAAAESPRGERAWTWRARARSALGDWAGAREDLAKALPALEAALEERRRGAAAPRAVAAAQGELADAHFRRGVAAEAQGLPEEAREDHRKACALGHPAACARAERRAAPPPAPKPKPAKPAKRRPVKSDPGERVYAN